VKINAQRCALELYLESKRKKKQRVNNATRKGGVVEGVSTWP